MLTVLTLLCMWGITFGLQNKVEFLRKNEFLDSMLSCTYCTGFHAGWITYLLTLPLHIPASVLPALSMVVLYAFGSAAWCYSVNAIVETFETGNTVMSRSLEEGD